jgi:indolepyruvate decarboxylase
MENQAITVVEYVVSRLAALGIDRVFGVPGDYSFPFDDAIEECPELEWIVCANELNAAYAADGYARLRGAAILTSTYGVGELSALNGMMGSKATRLPVFHIVGVPSLRIQKRKLITHHSLGDGVYGNFAVISATSACVSAHLTPETAIAEMERVIREALRLSAPAYITVAEDLARMPVIGTPIKGMALSNVKRNASSRQELEAALACVLERLRTAKTPVALPTQIVARYRLCEQLGAFLTRSRIPFALTPMDKGLLSEDHPSYIGLYNGDNSYPIDVRTIVEAADLILDIGGLIFEDLNTGLWSDHINSERLITLGKDFVTVGDEVFTSVTLSDILNGLIASAPVFGGLFETPPKTLQPLTGEGDDPLSANTFYPRLQRMLRAGDTLVAETGTCMLHMAKLRLPDGVGYQSQTLWGSIGWATPAAMGVAMADLGKRTILVTGDGSHQLTANEIGVMGRYGIKPVIFVLNNGLYGIEDVLSQVGHVYDDLAQWDYHKIPAAMGCKGWFAVRVATVAELERAIETAQERVGACYIEVMIPPGESQPLPVRIVDHLYKTGTPMS